MNFLEKLICEKRENIKVFWTGNKMKGVNKDTLQSGRDRYTANSAVYLSITLQSEFFLRYPFSLMLLMDFFKNMHNYHFINNKYGHKKM